MNGSVRRQMIKKDLLLFFFSIKDVFNSHFFLEKNRKAGPNALKESRCSTVFSGFNIIDESMTSPRISPFHSATTGSIRNLIFVECFVKYQNSRGAWATQKFVRREENCV